MRIPAIASGWFYGGLVAMIGWCYFCTAIPVWTPDVLHSDAEDYYNLLARGFLKGRLSLDVEADPFLATVKVIADPVERQGHGLYDVSYFRGRYYLYFGVTPVVTLFLPCRLLTGHFLPERLAPPIFATVGLACAVALLLAARRRYFPKVGPVPVAGSILALGLANMMPVLLRVTNFYTVPISCGYACCMASLWGIYQSLHARRGLPWLALAGMAFGLAVGSRPLYLFACPALLVPVLYAWRSRHGGVGIGRNGGWHWALLAAFVPLAIIGAGLAAYNFFRFGSPFDFGVRYQMGAGAKEIVLPLFSPKFFWFQFRTYGFAATGWTPYFPFVTGAVHGALPGGYFGWKDPYGVLPNMPFVIFAAGVASVLGRRGPGPRSALTAICGAILIAAAGPGLALCMYAGTTSRYMIDFVPGLILLGSIGWLALAAAAVRRAARASLNLAGVFLVAYSIFFNFSASWRSEDFLRNYHPDIYARLAHRWNGVSHAWDARRGTAYGPLELKVVFPEDRIGAVEPLVVTGRGPQSDYLFVRYLAPDLVSFGLEHADHGTVQGAPVRIEPGREHTLRVDLGSLYPPTAHPFFDRSAAEAVSLHATVRVAVDGRTALAGLVDVYDPVSSEPSIGTAGDRPGFREPFSGRIVGSRRMPELRGASSVPAPRRLVLIMPEFTGPRQEPLVSTGEFGHGDLVYVRYEKANEIAIGYDHWGLGGPLGPPIAIDPRGVQTIEVDFGALHRRPPVAAREGRVRVWINRRPALDAADVSYPAEPWTIALGINAIQASSASTRFTGTILDAGPVADLPP